MKSIKYKDCQVSVRPLLLLFGMLLLILHPVSTFGQPASDPWMEEMEKAKGLTVGDLKPRFGEPPPSGPGGAVRTGRDDDATASTQRTDDVAAAARTGPVDPDRLDPTNPDVARLIRQWTSTARPPENAVPGSNWRYDPVGRVVGSGPGMYTIDSRIHDSVQYARGTPEATAWSFRKKLDSIDHCTLEEYVVAKLRKKSISHCAGRYGALKDLKGERLDRAIGIVTGAGYKCDDPVPGSPADTAEANGTIERQEPVPDQYLKKGQVVKLVVHTPYVPGKVTLPSFIGESLGEAKKWLKKNKLEMQQPKVGTRASTREQSGTIEAQEPVAGTVMKTGGKVTLTVHPNYVASRSVPAVVGLSAGKAKALLENAGLKVNLKPGGKPSSRDQAGTVERQSPVAGASISSAKEVAIFVYGPYVDTVTVPDVSKLSYKEARLKLEAAGLSINKLDAGKPGNRSLAGKARKQDPLPETEVSRGKTVFVWFYGLYQPTREEQVAATNCIQYPGSQAYWDDAAGRPRCGCPDGLEWNIANTACVSPRVRDGELCEKERPGSIASSRDANGKVNCACPQGYVWDSPQHKQCVPQLTPEEVCARDYPGSVSTGRTADGRVNCGCPQGFVWETSERKRCIRQPSPEELCARDYPGSVPAGRTADGRVNCGCPQGFVWETPERKRCIRQPSPEVLCARDYPGSVPTGRTADGKVNCGCPDGYAWANNPRRCVKTSTGGGGSGVVDECSCKVDTSLMIRSDGLCTTFHESRDPQGRLDPHGRNTIIHIVHDDQFSRGWRLPNGWLRGRYNECRVLLKDSQDGCAGYCR